MEKTIKLLEGEVQIQDLTFGKYISGEKIQERIESLGKKIAADHSKTSPVFVAVLNGAFIFCADLVRAANINCEVAFLKVQSYEGTSSTGELKQDFTFSKNIKDRHIIIVEDIVDKGHTMMHLLDHLKSQHPKSINIASFLYKPTACLYDIKIDYLGFEIPADFVVGYGLDYNGFGRNLRDLYRLNS